VLTETVLKPADVSPRALPDRAGHREMADEITPRLHHRDLSRRVAIAELAPLVPRA
jgi:hypothetical protein